MDVNWYDLRWLAMYRAADTPQLARKCRPVFGKHNQPLFRRDSDTQSFLTYRFIREVEKLNRYEFSSAVARHLRKGEVSDGH